MCKTTELAIQQQVLFFTELLSVGSVISAEIFLFLYEWKMVQLTGFLVNGFQSDWICDSHRVNTKIWSYKVIFCSSNIIPVHFLYFEPSFKQNWPGELGMGAIPRSGETVGSYWCNLFVYLSLAILALFQEPADQSPGKWVGTNVFYNKQTFFGPSKLSE